ncbi:hypothetical protein PF005_g7625 [Phytophthora fragariae]|uniref:PiggyBac transposable element-derived protein domain-containing protein n=1 Tax=Phytophthora fragariae TaxID=53985 RepID=A0A6A3YME6_9STRA|nr:hypothetical protein PF005_g7625 [Phytophthora fragariae]KAE9242190.1 hypothetical protein PF004_g6719 [Phytophthora fragariae]KAE9247017.1 hypothetical protein PF002_g6473 [Phytophthora fragariae]
MWQHIAECSNFYMHEQLDDRVDAYLKKKEQKEQKVKAAVRAASTTKTKTRRDVRQDFLSAKPIIPHELCVYIGLMLARAIMPNREKLANHWHQDDVGAISRGFFRRFMVRDRLMELSRNLHFNSNSDPRARTDRAWKIRSVVNVLQRTFVAAFIPLAEFSFDEAMLPSRSTYNRTQMYMKDKPHKWGTKLFMLCCARSAYCIRFEVYCCQKQHIAESGAVDMKSGPAAVVRNLRAVFGGITPGKYMRLVVVDRFYTSIVLAVQLLLMGFFTIGTIMTNRRGFCKAVVTKKKKMPKDTPAAR